MCCDSAARDSGDCPAAVLLLLLSVALSVQVSYQKSWCMGFCNSDTRSDHCTDRRNCVTNSGCDLPWRKMIFFARELFLALKRDISL